MDRLTKAYSIKLSQTGFRRTTGRNRPRTFVLTDTAQGFASVSKDCLQINDLDIHSNDSIQDFYQNMQMCFELKK